MRPRIIQGVGGALALSLGLAGCGTPPSAHTVRVGGAVYYNESAHRVSVGWALMQVAPRTQVQLMPASGLPAGSHSALLRGSNGVAVRILTWPQRYLPWSAAPGRVFGILPPAWTFSAAWHGMESGGRPVVWMAASQSVTIATSNEATALQLPVGHHYRISAAWVVSPAFHASNAHPWDTLVIAYWPTSLSGWNPTQFWSQFFHQWIWLPQTGLSPLSGSFSAVPADATTWNAVFPIPSTWQVAAWPQSPPSALHPTGLRAWVLPSGMIGAVAHVPNAAGVTASLVLRRWAGSLPIHLTSWATPWAPSGTGAGGQWVDAQGRVWHVAVLPDGARGWILWAWIASSSQMWSRESRFATQWLASINWQATPPLGVSLYGVLTFSRLWSQS